MLTDSIKKPDCLVVLSGGQDSTTCLFWAKKYFGNVHAVTFDYGQRHRIEIQAARDVAKIAGVVSHEVVTLGPILNGTSPLTNPDEVLETYGNHADMTAIIGDRVEKTFVPMRNALFLTLAANRAVCLGVDHIVTGVCQADGANYPDCRASFIGAQETAINQALGTGRICIHSPLMGLDKAASIVLTDSLTPRIQLHGPAPSLSLAYLTLAFTHTAYDGQYPPVGQDHATVLRAYGFEQAGCPDPLVIRACREGLMQVPATLNYAHTELNASIADGIVLLQQKYQVGV